MTVRKPRPFSLVASMLLLELSLAGCGDPQEGPIDAWSFSDAVARPDARPDPPDARPRPDALERVDAIPDCADDAEPNDSIPYSLGVFSDSPDTSETFAAFNLHQQDDLDLYTIEVVDAGYDGNADITVQVTPPAGDEYRLTAAALCTDGVEVTSVNCFEGEVVAGTNSCRSPTGQAAVETIGMELNCSGTSTDSGSVDLRIEPVGAITTCAAYSLEVLVE